MQDESEIIESLLFWVLAVLLTANNTDYSLYMTLSFRALSWRHRLLRTLVLLKELPDSRMPGFIGQQELLWLSQISFSCTNVSLDAGGCFHSRPLFLLMSLGRLSRSCLLVSWPGSVITSC